MQLVFSCAPKLAKKVRVNIGFPVVRTDGRRSVYGHVITKFSGMGRFAKLWGSAHARAKQEDNSEGDIHSTLFGEYLGSWTNLKVEYRR